MARWAWVAMAGLLGAGALALHALPTTSIDWQPALALHEPWRAWSAVFVHYSQMHLVANLAGALLVGALGVAAHLPARSVAAWFAAWPLTQAMLLVQPALLHYGGLSGVLHAGVAVVAVHLLCAGGTGQRRFGAVMLAALVVKVLNETPWAGPLRHPPGWDIAVAPMSHAGGLLMGAACSALAEALNRRSAHTGDRDD